MLHWEVFLRGIAFECTFMIHLYQSPFKKLESFTRTKSHFSSNSSSKSHKYRTENSLNFPPCSFRVWVINWQVTLATKHKYEWLMNLALTRFLSQSWLSGTMVQRALHGALVFLIFLDFGTSLKCYVCNNFKNTFQVRNWKTLWRRSKRALKCL